MSKYKDWQPIETAPKNLNQLMLCCGDYICIGRWSGHFAHWEDSSSGLVLTHPQPDHWMNMPELPDNELD